MGRLREPSAVVARPAPHAALRALPSQPPVAALLQRSLGNAALARATGNATLQRVLYHGSARGKGKGRARPLSELQYYQKLERLHGPALRALEAGEDQYVSNKAELVGLISEQEALSRARAGSKRKRVSEHAGEEESEDSLDGELPSPTRLEDSEEVEEEEQVAYEHGASSSSSGLAPTLLAPGLEVGTLVKPYTVASALAAQRGRRGSVEVPHSRTRGAELLANRLRGYHWLTHHRHLVHAGELESKQRGARATQNQVRASLGIIVATADGGQRALTVDLRKTFKSGGSAPASTSAVRRQGTLPIAKRRDHATAGAGKKTAGKFRKVGDKVKRVTRTVKKTTAPRRRNQKANKIARQLVSAGVIQSEDDFRPELHAHSEQEMVSWLREASNVESVLDRLAELLSTATDLSDPYKVTGILLDLVSYPNTVCSPCHQTVDWVMDAHVRPAVEKRFKAKGLGIVVNASARSAFRGGGAANADRTHWVEHVVDYAGLSEAEKRARDLEARKVRGRARRRGEKGTNVTYTGGSRQRKRPRSGRAATKQAVSEPEELEPEELEPEELARRQALARHVGGSLVPISGRGNKCYIRALVTGLREVYGAKLDIETYVNAIVDHLKDAGLRTEGSQIDAGSLVAAEVRRVIQELTTEVIYGGFDIGVNVVQYGPADERGVAGPPTTFQANTGRYMITVAYTPGHFDLVRH